MPHELTHMTHEEAKVVAADDVVWRWDSPWKVMRVSNARPDSSKYLEDTTSPYFLVRLGKTGNNGHEHWNSWQEFALKPCCGE